jgi:hypothetical protein
MNRPSDEEVKKLFKQHGSEVCFIDSKSDGCHMMVFDEAKRWAKKNFRRLEGKPYDPDLLVGELRRLLSEFPGIKAKKWLFIYSPTSDSQFFEVSEDLPRFMVGCAKLAAVARGGGMLVGADFSENWGTPQCVGKFIPLLVCKPQVPTT